MPYNRRKRRRGRSGLNKLKLAISQCPSTKLTWNQSDIIQVNKVGHVTWAVLGYAQSRDFNDGLEWLNIWKSNEVPSYFGCIYNNNPGSPFMRAAINSYPNAPLTYKLIEGEPPSAQTRNVNSPIYVYKDKQYTILKNTTGISVDIDVYEVYAKKDLPYGNTQDSGSQFTFTDPYTCMMAGFKAYTDVGNVFAGGVLNSFSGTTTGPRVDGPVLTNENLIDDGFVESVQKLPMSLYYNSYFRKFYDIGKHRRITVQGGETVSFHNEKKPYWINQVYNDVEKSLGVMRGNKFHMLCVRGGIVRNTADDDVTTSGKSNLGLVTYRSIYYKTPIFNREFHYPTTHINVDTLANEAFIDEDNPVQIVST